MSDPYDPILRLVIVEEAGDIAGELYDDFFLPPYDHDPTYTIDDEGYDYLLDDNDDDTYEDIRLEDLQ